MKKHAFQPCFWMMLVLAQIPVVNGCAGITDCKYDLGQKIRTSQAWHAYNSCHDECFTCDYRNGWKAGYFDVLTGGEGCPPIIAPKRYWKPPVFFQYDPSARDEWYCGFQDGAACAKTQPDSHYLKLWLPPAARIHQTGYGISVPDLPDYCPPEELADDSPTNPEHVTAPPADVAADGESSTDETATPEPVTEEQAPVPPEDAPATDAVPDASDEKRHYEDDAPPTSQLDEFPGRFEEFADSEASSCTPFMDSLIRSNAAKPSCVQQLLINSAREALSVNQAAQLNDPKHGDGGVMEAFSHGSSTTQEQTVLPARQVRNAPDRSVIAPSGPAKTTKSKLHFTPTDSEIPVASNN